MEPSWGTRDLKILMLPVVRKKADQKILSVVLINYLRIRKEGVEEIKGNEMFSL